MGVHKRIGLWWDAQPNEMRLSCGALKKDSFLTSTRAVSFKRVLGSGAHMPAIERAQYF